MKHWRIDLNWWLVRKQDHVERSKVNKSCAQNEKHKESGLEAYKCNTIGFFYPRFCNGLSAVHFCSSSKVVHSFVWHLKRTPGNHTTITYDPSEHWLSVCTVMTDWQKKGVKCLLLLLKHGRAWCNQNSRVRMNDFPTSADLTETNIFLYETDIVNEATVRWHVRGSLEKCFKTALLSNVWFKNRCGAKTFLKKV